MPYDQAENIETADQFDDTPEGWQARWTVEMNASKDFLKSWVEKSDKVLKRYLDDRSSMDGSAKDTSTRVNVFTANIQTQRALLYGKTPNVDVKRRFADPDDEPARVAGEALQRMLNTDLERDSDTYVEALEMALDDRLLPGLGAVRLRYEVEYGPQPPEVPPQTATDLDGQEIVLAPGYQPPPPIVKEDVAVDYVHWKDRRWSPCRNRNDLRWVAYKAEMTRAALHKRFDSTIAGEDVALGAAMVDNLPLKAKERNSNQLDEKREDPWDRAEVWEIWSKDERKVFWWVEGAERILDVQDDLLGLDGFWPEPPPMMANLTTSKHIPTPDFTLAQDLYDEIDAVSERITKLERAVKAVGVYDSTSNELKRLMSEATDNQMIPVENFAMFAEKGGIKGAVDWLPLEQFVAALDKLREYRTELISLLYQVTGMSDIMRGQSSGQTTATEQAIKAKFASTRMQYAQAEFARFASDILALKAEIISKHFAPETILKRANMEYMSAQDKQHVQKAVEIIKTGLYQYRISVKPETISMQDYAVVKEERSAMLTAVGSFLQSAMPVIQAAPMLGPMLLQVMQWSIAGFRGSATIEGAIDQGVMQFQQALMAPKPPPQPDPAQIMELQMQREKAQTERAKGQMDLQAHAVKTKIDTDKALLDHRLTLEQQQAKLRAAAVEGALERENDDAGEE